MRGSADDAKIQICLPMSIPRAVVRREGVSPVRGAETPRRHHRCARSSPSAFVSLDGVMQAPGGPDEDPTGGFKLRRLDRALLGRGDQRCHRRGFSQNHFDLLLGRRTYDIFAAHWPYVDTDLCHFAQEQADRRPVQQRHQTCRDPRTRHADLAAQQAARPDVPAAVRKLKQGDGPDLLIQGSSELIQQLLAADLIDEFRLLIYPLVLGRVSACSARARSPLRSR